MRIYEQNIIILDFIKKVFSYVEIESVHTDSLIYINKK